MTFHQMIVLLVPICSIVNCFFSATTTVRIRPLPPGGLRRGVRFNELFYYVESPIALAFPIIFQGKFRWTRVPRTCASPSMWERTSSARKCAPQSALISGRRQNAASSETSATDRPPPTTLVRHTAHRAATGQSGELYTTEKCRPPGAHFAQRND